MNKLIVRGCAEYEYEGENCVAVVEDDAAQFWGVYEVKDDNTESNVADFVHKEDAELFVAAKTGDDQQEIRVLLPDGRILASRDKRDDDYPGIRIDIVDKYGIRDIIAWAEYNTGRQDYDDKERLRILIWSRTQDEPEANLGYDTGLFEKD